MLGNAAWLTREHAYQKELAEDAKGTWEGAREEFGNGRRNVRRQVLFSFSLNVEKERSLGVQGGDALELLEEGHWVHIQAGDKFTQFWIGGSIQFSVRRRNRIRSVEKCLQDCNC